jgi:hypothetical protein
MKTETQNRLGYLKVKFYKDFNVLQCEYPIHATLQEVQELCEGLGIPYSSAYSFFTSGRECFLTVHCNKKTGICLIGDKRIEPILFMQLMNKIFGYKPSKPKEVE